MILIEITLFTCLNSLCLSLSQDHGIRVSKWQILGSAIQQVIQVTVVTHTSFWHPGLVGKVGSRACSAPAFSPQYTCIHFASNLITFLK